MKTLILTITLALVATAYPCDNDCWLEKNKFVVIKHPELKGVFDQICEQGRPVTKRQRKVAKRFHLKNCGHPTPVAPTPTPIPTPNASPTPTATATPITTPHITPTPSPTPTPVPTATPTPRPTPSPTSTPTSPTPTPSPTCTPHGGCTRSTIEWRDDPDWPLMHMYIGSHNRVYERMECQDILEYPGNAGDGLDPLAREVIAAQLNIAAGAGHECVDALLTEADLIIGDLIPQPVGTGKIPLGNVQDLINQLAAYNKGESCCAARCH